MAIHPFVEQYVSWPQFIPVLACVVVVSCLWRNRYAYGLQDIPGPFLASLTDLWRFWVVWKGDAHTVHKNLHQQYGDIVRLGPRTLSFANPEALYDIYSGKKAYRKSDFYRVQQFVRDGKVFATIFSTTYDTYHKALRRATSNAYALTTLLQFEPFVDSTTTVFLNRIDSTWADKAGPAGVCDLATWLQYYAFDVIAELTFSKRLGFIEEGRDISGIIGAIERNLRYVAPVGQYPFLDWLIRKNPIKLFLGRIGLTRGNLKQVAFMAQQLNARRAQITSETLKSDTAAGRPRDFISRFMEAHLVTGSIDEEQVISLSQVNINAGSDTTAISLRAVFYFLLKTPRCYEKLMAEIKGAEKSGHFRDRTTGLVSWTEANQLPYLDAVMKEALRQFPAVGLMLERIVPAGGAEIAGVSVPGGTIVGSNPWVIHARREIYGDDAGTFRPERWLEASEERLAAMKRYMITFGLGSHTCIGKNISYLEMYKVVAAIMRRFHVELANPNTEWRLHNAWFVRQTGLDVRFRKRQMLSPAAA